MLNSKMNYIKETRVYPQAMIPSWWQALNCCSGLSLPRAWNNSPTTSLSCFFFQVQQKPSQESSKTCQMREDPPQLIWISCFSVGEHSHHTSSVIHRLRINDRPWTTELSAKSFNNLHQKLLAFFIYIKHYSC